MDTLLSPIKIGSLGITLRTEMLLTMLFLFSVLKLARFTLRFYLIVLLCLLTRLLNKLLVTFVLYL